MVFIILKIDIYIKNISYIKLNKLYTYQIIYINIKSRIIRLLKKFIIANSHFL